MRLFVPKKEEAGVEKKAIRDDIKKQLKELELKNVNKDIKKILEKTDMYCVGIDSFKDKKSGDSNYRFIIFENKFNKPGRSVESDYHLGSSDFTDRDEYEDYMQNEKHPNAFLIKGFPKGDNSLIICSSQKRRGWILRESRPVKSYLYFKLNDKEFNKLNEVEESKEIIDSALEVFRERFHKEEFKNGGEYNPLRLIITYFPKNERENAELYNPIQA